MGSPRKQSANPPTQTARRNGPPRISWLRELIRQQASLGELTAAMQLKNPVVPAKESIRDIDLDITNPPPDPDLPPFMPASREALCLCLVELVKRVEQAGSHFCCVWRSSVVARLNAIAGALGYKDMIALERFWRGDTEPRRLARKQRLAALSKDCPGGPWDFANDDMLAFVLHVRDPFSVNRDTQIFLGVGMSSRPMGRVGSFLRANPDAAAKVVEELRRWIEVLKLRGGDSKELRDPAGTDKATAPPEQTTPCARAIALMFDAQRAGRPIPKVNELARMVGCHRTTLSRDRQFKAARKVAMSPLTIPHGTRTKSGDIEAEDPAD